MGLKKVIKKIKKHVDRALDYVKDKTVNAIAWATGEKHKAEKEANKLKREANAAKEAHENSMALIRKQQGHARMLTNIYENQTDIEGGKAGAVFNNANTKLQNYNGDGSLFNSQNNKLQNYSKTKFNNNSITNGNNSIGVQ